MSASLRGCVLVSLRALRAHSLFAQKLKHLSKLWRKSCVLDLCLMEHPAGQAASAAKPDRSNADKNDDNATAARLLPREEDTQGAPSSAAQPAASSKEKPTEEQKTPSASKEKPLGALLSDS